MALSKITADSIADNSLTAANVSDGSITTTKLADSAVTSAKIGVDVIVAEDLAANSVTVSELTDGAVTPAKLSTGHPNWDSSGNVGIGTSSPTNALNVQYNSGSTTAKFENTGTSGTATDSAIVTISSTSRDASLSITSNSTKSSIVNFGDEVNLTRGRLVYAHSDDSMQVTVAGSERMRIDSSGKVGIGTTSPNGNLTVNGSDGLIIRNATAGGAYGPWVGLGVETSGGPAIWMRPYVENGTTFASSISFANWNGSTATEKMRIDSAGRVTMPYQPSFRAFKTSSWSTGNSVITGWSTFHNTGNHLNTSTGVFTAPVAGVYQVSFHWLTDNTTTQSDVHIRLNGAPNNGIRTRSASSAGHQTTSGSQSIYMSANDTLDFFFESGDKVYMDVSQTWTSWSVTLLG